MPLKLAEVPQILDFMVKNEVLRPEGKQEVLDAIKSGEKGFAGEIAVKHNLVNVETLNRQLLEQAAEKAAAAEADIMTITNSGKQDAPKFLKANWGNNGVNKAAEKPTLVDGATAAANIAQNMVMLANDKPDVARELIVAVAAARKLADGLTKGDRTPAEMLLLKEQAFGGLATAVQYSGAAITDAKGNPVSLEAFALERNKEIDGAINISLRVQQERGPLRGVAPSREGEAEKRPNAQQGGRDR